MGTSVKGGGDLIPFLEEGGRPFSYIKSSMINHANSRIVDGKIIGFMCVCQLLSLLLGNFLFENFPSVQVPIQISRKSVYNCLVITLRKCEYCLT